MKKNFNYLLLGLLLLLFSYGQAQEFNGFWMTSDSICIQFDSKTNRMNIDHFYDDINEGKQRFEYKVKDSVLLIKWRHNQRLFRYEVDEKNIYSIELIKDNNVKLKFIKSSGRGVLSEILSNKNITLKRLGSVCPNKNKIN